MRMYWYLQRAHSSTQACTANFKSLSVAMLPQGGYGGERVKRQVLSYNCT